MSSGVRKAFKGAFVGTGAQIDITHIGFRPARVELFNAGAGLSRMTFLSAMPDGSGFKEVTDGTSTFVTGGNGVTPLAQGFRLGADANMNIAGQTVYFDASE